MNIIIKFVLTSSILLSSTLPFAFSKMEGPFYQNASLGSGPMRLVFHTDQNNDNIYNLFIYNENLNYSISYVIYNKDQYKRVVNFFKGTGQNHFDKSLTSGFFGYKKELKELEELKDLKESLESLKRFKSLEEFKSFIDYKTLRITVELKELKYLKDFYDLKNLEELRDFINSKALKEFKDLEGVKRFIEAKIDENNKVSTLLRSFTSLINSGKDLEQIIEIIKSKSFCYNDYSEIVNKMNSNSLQRLCLETQYIKGCSDPQPVGTSSGVFIRNQENKVEITRGNKTVNFQLALENYYDCNDSHNTNFALALCESVLSEPNNTEKNQAEAIDSGSTQPKQKIYSGNVFELVRALCKLVLSEPNNTEKNQAEATESGSTKPKHIYSGKIFEKALDKIKVSSRVTKSEKELLKNSKILAVYAVIKNEQGKDSIIWGLAEDKETKEKFHWMTDLEDDISVLFNYVTN